ncbi:hypothetical protein K6U06_24305 [Acidiferrimicrobium sp. IK]|uniref:hypothetical protein n=1 Tax=Acidiferrimicrobium sp. IK TaxID=2871700 RepID=UPI0021CB68A1|nr:hypothetical protein [Acidiferrimicrobium sp. IK]MCU4187502.1 hypothetical protein [Acidiferrimicrobium sp. IK]
MPGIVCCDQDEAAAAVAAGADVVLLTSEPVPAAVAGRAGGAAAGRAGGAARGGRLAVFIGDPASPADRAAAAEMATELFARDNPSRSSQEPTPGGH